MFLFNWFEYHPDHFAFLPFNLLQSRAKFSMVTSSVLNFLLYLTVERIIQSFLIHFSIKAIVYLSGVNLF